jgi:hypothetical protein
MKLGYVLPIALIAVVPLLSQCKDDSQVEMQIMESETQSIKLTQKLRLLEMQSKQADVVTDRDVHAVNQKEQQARVKLAELREVRDALHADIHSLEGEFGAIEKAVIAYKRNSAMGKNFAVFETKQSSYRDVVIKSVTETGLEIKHSSGSARITPMQLSDSQLDEFGLSVESAREVIAAEQRIQQHYMANMDRVLEKQKEEELSRFRLEEEHRRDMQKAEATLAAYRAPERKSLLAETPPTKVYRVRSYRPQFYNVWYPNCSNYSNFSNRSCYNHSTSYLYRRPQAQRIEPILPHLQ